MVKTRTKKLDRLTPLQQIQLHEKIARGVPVRRLGEEYGITKDTVSRYIREQQEQKAAFFLNFSMEEKERIHEIARQVLTDLLWLVEEGKEKLEEYKRTKKEPLYVKMYNSLVNLNDKQIRFLTNFLASKSIHREIAEKRETVISPVDFR